MDEARQRHHHRWGLIALVSVLVLSFGVAFAIHEIEPPEPGAFYTPPDPVPAEPGRLLRVEPFHPPLDGADGYRVLYASTAPDGSPVAVSGQVLVPRTDMPNGGWPVVAWAHGTSGVARRCAPTLASNPVALIAGAQELLDRGWVVAATDYPGLGTPGPHPYLIGPSEATAVIDSVRAVDQLDDVSTNGRFIVWGHSQGGHAAMWTGQQAADYAPELDLVAVAAAAPAIELTELVRADLGTLSGNALMSFALVAWSEYDPEADLDRILTPAGRPLARTVAAGCIETTAQVDVLGPLVLAEKLSFTVGDPTELEPWATMLTENTPDAPIAVPILIAQGTADEIVRPETTVQAVTARCDQGETVTFTPYPGLSHTEVARAAVPQVVDWIADRFAGREVTGDCDDLPPLTPAG